MKVVHLSTYHGLGGASKAHFRIHRSLVDSGCDSLFFYLRGQQEMDRDEREIELKPPEGIFTRFMIAENKKKIMKDLGRHPDRQSQGREIFTHDRSGLGGYLNRLLPDFDVLQLNWVSGLVDYKSFFGRLDSGTKVVWRLADMNPFTGGCHFSDGCENYTESCGCCHQLDSDDRRDLSYQILKRKRRALSFLRSNQLHVVCVSDWMLKHVENSSTLQRFSRSKIPTGVDHHLFKPQDRKALRLKYGLPDDKKILLFVADQKEEKKRKGGVYLSKIAEKLGADDRFLFLEVGSSTSREENAQTAKNFRSLGQIENEMLMSEYYGLSDGFVYTGVEDNLPNTVLEAMSSGLIVFAYHTGGVPDVIINGTNGYLFNRGEVDSVVDTIRNVFDSTDKKMTLSVEARKTIEANHTLALQGERYLNLYERLLA